jgi:cytochrome c peroxidase
VQRIFFKGQTKVLFLLFALFIIYSFSSSEKSTPGAVLDQYKVCLDSLQNVITAFQEEAPVASHDRMKQLFVSARLQYKKIEFLVEYHYPANALKLNGPVLPESEPSEPNEPEHPTGFQVLEEHVYDELDENTRSGIIYELSNIDGRLKRLYALLPELELTESNILDAVRLNIFRLITKGITGFDSPVALNSIQEALTTLQSAREFLSFFPAPDTMLQNIDNAAFYIHGTGYHFDTFNRAVFIEKYMNPVCISLHDYQTGNNISFTSRSRAIFPAARTLFDKDAFDPLFYAPSGTVAATAGQIALGQKLFGEPLLSVNNKRSCRSCHVPEKAFTDGLTLNETITGNKKLLRNTPSLLNAALQPVLFYDSHMAFLEDQAHDVISNRQEMGGMFEIIQTQFQKDKVYRDAFAAVYPGKAVSADNIKAALAAYVRSLTSMNSRFDEYMRGDVKAMSEDEVQGFNLFMGKAKCGTCHFMPLFSGTVPPLFDKMESEVLGVPASADTLQPVQDTDPGKYLLYNIPHQRFSFKTTTVRNAARTAPYMHNGVFNTLEEVILFYNHGGGAGLGFDLPNQTLPPDKLHLDMKEQNQIIAFIGALSDDR